MLFFAIIKLIFRKHILEVPTTFDNNIIINIKNINANIQLYYVSVRTFGSFFEYKFAFISIIYLLAYN